MIRKLFGTDGIRGTSNEGPITAETILSVAMSVAIQFRRGHHRHRVVIGKDTRLSGYLLEPALTAGFIAMGMDVILLGPLPTPAVAVLTRSLRADLGVMISASHNPFQDNGIKLFGPDGFKLLDTAELEIEGRIGTDLREWYAKPAELGRASRLEDASGRYIEFVKNTFPRDRSLEDLKIVVDCAHGAGYRVAPKVFFELGAEVIAMNHEPDGLNINKDCGTLAPEGVRRRVIEEEASLGITLDGDADRVLIVDETGHVIDGDQMMALVATVWFDEGRLRGGGVVSTVMSNMGLERYLKDVGLSLVRTPVGDRYVVEYMRGRGYNVGGEPSGHIVLSDYTTTGDGLIAALQLLSVVVKRGESVSRLCRVFESFPQKRYNIRYDRGSRTEILRHPKVVEAIAAAKNRLGKKGRLLIRNSGTEPIIRIMVEGEDMTVIDKTIAMLVETIESVKTRKQKVTG